MKTIELDKDLAGTKSYGDGMPMTAGFSEEKNYPEFSFTESEPCDLPDEGELTIKFRLTRHATDVTNEDRPKYSYTVCVKKLISAKGASDKFPTRNYSKAGGEALDALVAEKESASELEEY